MGTSSCTDSYFMTVLFPKVAYYKKPHNLKRFRKRDENGVSLWRKYLWRDNKKAVDIQMDTLDSNYTTTSDFIIFYP